VLHEVADGIFHLPLAPRSAMNAWLLGDVLVDAGLKSSGGKVVKALDGRDLSAHALTHVHPDHAGGSKRVAEARGVPVWAPAADAPFLRQGRCEAPAAIRPFAKVPALEPARELREGDALGDTGFVVLDTPGHTRGHVSFWREADRVLVAGDVLFGLHPLTTVAGLHEPLKLPTFDVAQNQASIRRLAELRPALLLLGHGPPHRAPDALGRLAASL
jgi:hydroxyacylglutathione hydrolase